MSQVSRNAATSVAQSAITTASLFFVYRLAVHTVGVAAVGQWSLAFAISQTGRAIDLGVAPSVSRLVAERVAADRHGDVASLTIAGVAVSAAIAIAVSLLLLGAIAVGQRWALIHVPRPTAELLPWAVACFIAGVIAATLNSAMDGLQQMVTRNAIGIAAAFVFLVVAFGVLPSLGILGLAIAQLAQSATVIALTLLGLLRRLRGACSKARLVHPAIVSELMRKSGSIQTVSLSVVLFEPTTKILLAKFSTIEAVGAFEIASRLVGQVRSLILAAVQAVAPAIAYARVADNKRVVVLYTQSYSITLSVGLAAAGILVSIAPFVGRFWMGVEVPMLRSFIIILACGWFVNIASAPGYFVGMATARMRWLVTGHAALAAINVAAGIALGRAFGAMGVVCAAMMALACASTITLVGQHSDMGLPMRDLLPRECRPLLIGVVTSTPLVCALGFLVDHGTLSIYSWLSIVGLTIALQFWLVLRNPLVAPFVSLSHWRPHSNA